MQESNCVTGALVSDAGQFAFGLATKLSGPSARSFQPNPPPKLVISSTYKTGRQEDVLKPHRARKARLTPRETRVFAVLRIWRND